MGRTGFALTALAALVVAGCTSGAAAPHSVGASRTASTAPTPAVVVSSAPTSSPAPSTTARSSVRRTVSPTRPSTRPKPKPARTSARPAGRPLPLGFRTGSATEVITVVAPSTGSTHATLQAWRKAAGGWRTVGPAVAAWVGSDGLSRSPSESSSATPIGSFTLTQAFGHDANPGTSLPYLQTTPDDWWISQAGPLYNTRQRCSAGCGFTQGDPNEHLYYETPYYDYAVVIDYNTRNAPGGVRQGAGSAFFLHVTVGEPTAGCVSIPADQLVRILRWLTPSRHPRILIGVA